MSVPVAVGEEDTADAVEPPPGAGDAGGGEDDEAPHLNPSPLQSRMWLMPFIATGRTNPDGIGVLRR